MLDGIVQQRERAEPEEVHLEEPDALDLLHRPLRRDFAVVLLALVERDELGERPGGDHDAGGVDRGVTGHALEPARDREQILHAGVPLLELLQRRVFRHRQVERHLELVRDELGDAIDVGDRHLHDAADVADGRPRLHGAEGDDLRDVLAPVLLGDVVDHLAAPALAEVDVDIGQRHPLGVEEPLEVQIEVQGIDVGNLQAVGHEAAGRRAAARAHRDLALACVADEVPDDQEVPGYFMRLMSSIS